MDARAANLSIDEDVDSCRDGRSDRSRNRRIVEQLHVIGKFDGTRILFASVNGANAEIMVRGRGHDPDATPGSDPTYLLLGACFFECL